MLTPTPTTLNVLPLPAVSVEGSLPEPLVPQRPPIQGICLPEAHCTDEVDALRESYISWLVGIQELLTALANRGDDLRDVTVTADEYKRLSVMIEEVMWYVGDNTDAPFAPVEGCIGSFMINYENKNVPTLEEVFPHLREEPVEIEPELEEIIARLAEKNKDFHVPTQEEIAIDAFFSLGSLLAEVGKTENAIAAYDVAIRLKPDYAAAYCNRGSSQYAKGNYTAALHDYNEAIRLTPGRSEGYFNRAVTHFQRHDYTAAVHDYDAALACNPDDADAYVGRAHANFALHRYEAAMEDYDAALRLAPANEAARRYRDIAQAQVEAGITG